MGAIRGFPLFVWLVSFVFNPLRLRQSGLVLSVRFRGHGNFRSLRKFSRLGLQRAMPGPLNLGSELRQ
jgi:hypothetical protein